MVETVPFYPISFSRNLFYPKHHHIFIKICKTTKISTLNPLNFSKVFKNLTLLPQQFTRLFAAKKIKTSAQNTLVGLITTVLNGCCN